MKLNDIGTQQTAYLMQASLLTIRFLKLKIKVCQSVVKHRRSICIPKWNTVMCWHFCRYSVHISNSVLMNVSKSSDRPRQEIYRCKLQQVERILCNLNYRICYHEPTIIHGCLFTRDYFFICRRIFEMTPRRSQTLFLHFPLPSHLTESAAEHAQIQNSYKS